MKPLKRLVACSWHFMPHKKFRRNRARRRRVLLDSKECIKNMSHKAHVRHDSARHKQEELKLLEVIHICRISQCLLRCCDETNDEKNILQIKRCVLPALIRRSCAEQLRWWLFICKMCLQRLRKENKYARSVRFSAKSQWYICKQFGSKVVQLGSRASPLMVLAYVFDWGVWGSDVSGI